MRPPWRKRLTTRIVAITLAVLMVVLAMIGVTLWLSWRIDGAVAAVNETGSLRMRAYRIGLELSGDATDRTRRVNEQFTRAFATLALLDAGSTQGPLMLPDDPDVRAQLHNVAQYWHDTAYPHARQALASGSVNAYLESLPDLAARTNALVRMIEMDNARKTAALRLAQTSLAVLGVLGAGMLFLLLYLWIIAPVLRLSQGLRRMARHEFGLRLPVDSHDELGMVAAGFNCMASELQSLYGELERRVAEKTGQLEAQNRKIAAQYEMAAFLNRSGDFDAMCEGFLRRVIRHFDADGASLRTLDTEHGLLSLVAAVGLPDALQADRCRPVSDCHCGKAAQGREVFLIRDLASEGGHADICSNCEGFAVVAAFRIVCGEEALGSFSLHFCNPRTLSAGDRQLLESLSQLLGVALQNRRLAAKARELAVVQERGLVAQGLHDSLAQALNFLNLQLQLMEDAMRRGDMQEAGQILPLLRQGVDESYQDVRELLSNFRSRLEQGSLRTAIEKTVQRFRRQAAVPVTLEMPLPRAAELAPEQQLQVLFILQEALSNVRKHAEAGHVRVHVENRQDFILRIEDDGRGYDPQTVKKDSESHVGLYIMRERAARMNAHICMDSEPGRGTCIVLRLPASERLPA